MPVTAAELRLHRRSTTSTGEENFVTERNGQRRGGHLGRLARHDSSASTTRSAMRSLWEHTTERQRFAFSG